MTTPTGTERLYARLTRRETHSPRAVVAITVAVIIIVALTYLGTELVLHLLGQPALLLAPSAMASTIADAPSFAPSLMIGGGTVAAIIGIILIIVSVSPGRRSRHVVVSPNSAIVVDNAVIASALARHAARTAGVSPDNTVVSVGHRTALVEVTPASGVAVDVAAVEEAVTRQLESYSLSPRVTAKVKINSSGKVGA